ncbi:hypothetical protein B0H17DRAFT_939406, partial [Mycena rosella]
RHAEISAVRQEGTEHWLLVDVCFKEWKAESGGILWCRGMSGVGKTVLACVLFKNITFRIYLTAVIGPWLSTISNCSSKTTTLV